MIHPKSLLVNSFKHFTGYHTINADMIEWTATNVFIDRAFSSAIPWISPLNYLKPTSYSEHFADPFDTQKNSMVEFERRPSFLSHEITIRMIQQERDLQRALDIFNRAGNQRGFNHNHKTYSIILHKLALSKKFDAVEGILRQMSFDSCKIEEGLFLNLMSHYSKSSLPEKTLQIFYSIRSFVGQKPSLKALSTCLNLLVESNRLDLVHQLLSNLKNLNLVPNTCIFNILVKYHCKHENIDAAFDIVRKKMTKNKCSPNVITYSTLMGGLCNGGRLNEAIQLFEEMVSAKILPDTLTYNVLISGFCQAGNIDGAKKIISFMRKNGCEPNLFNYSTLMNGFCKHGRLEEAREVWDELRRSGFKPDAVTYTTVINCLCRIGRVDEALRMLGGMERDCKADIVTFNVIIGGLCREGRFGEAISMLENLPHQGVKLNKASYRIVLNFLCKEGDMEMVMDLLDLMLQRGFVPHFATSNEVLVSLCKAGKVIDATKVLYELAQMGFKPETDSWICLIESICRERKMVKSIELLDDLVESKFQISF